ncbi:MAG: ATP-dependent DNA helicase pcrA [Burkholderiaceae bacterium]|nr:MAG: ATP-dependent DNA helicase pcrA [Burkholderiaceae bacterium]
MTEAVSELAYEHNGKRVSSAAFYAIACDPRRSVAVEACAGAGKTWMLVSRIVRALLDGAQDGEAARVRPHEILAITFTKKAAGEMRQRLNDWLADFAQAAPERLEQELLLRGVSPANARNGGPALKNLYASVLASGRPVQIRTFHSWFAALLGTAPLAVLEALGLPAHYELLEDDAQAIQAVWPRFYQALIGLPEARQDYFAAVAAHGRFQTEKALTAALARRVEFALADAQGVVERSVPRFDRFFPDFAGLDEPEEWLAEPAHRQQLQATAQALGRASAPTFSAKGMELEQAITNRDMQAAAAALLTQKGEPRKFSEKVAGIEQVRAAQELLLRVAQARAQHDAWLHQQRMARLTRVLCAEFAALKRERGWIDMNDVERAAQFMLSNPVLGGWVQERLDAQIKHLLVDEFQDTNPLQWQALGSWLSGYAGAGGQAPSVFIVGDPKQSIYRFRRAEPQVFLAAQKFVVEGLGGDLLSCDHTRRNAPEVLAVVNQVMAAAQHAGDYQGFRAHSTASTEVGAVLRLPQIARPGKDESTAQDDDGLTWRDSLTTPRELPEETLRTLECRQAARWLAQQLAGGLQPRHVMVLARKRDRLAVMQEELRALHIPSQQPEKTDLGEAPEVRDIVALLDALVSPSHDLSTAQALKSPLFGLSDADLVRIALLQRHTRADGAAGASGGSWFELLQQTELKAPNGQGLTAVLMQWKGWLATLPPHDALDRIYADGDVLARFCAATPEALQGSVLANLRAVLVAALDLGGGARYATPYALVRALKAGGVKAPAMADTNAVRLLTVHGAKGLEAPLVLLLDTDAPAPAAATMGVLLDWPGEAPAPRSFMFLASETSPPPSAVAALQIEGAARAREELNGLYVAMTRARAQLLLSSLEPGRANVGSWWQRLQALATPVDEPAGALPAAPDVLDAPGAPPFLLPILPQALVGRAQSAIKTEADGAGTRTSSLESLIGQAMHRLLEWAPLGAKDFSSTQIQSVAREFALDGPQAQQAAQMAQRILRGEGGWAWDPELVAWHGNEVALSWQGKSLRLDRLVRRKDVPEWWVLDYKSAAQPQGQAEPMAQLQTYRAAVQAQYPADRVRAAFLNAQGGLHEVVGDA